MSRLDSFINRLTAQRDLLNHIARESLLPAKGAILELGLGNGRTFNHLREVFSDRRIIVFDRALAAHTSSIPAEENVVLGEISVTAERFAGQNAAMVHADIGTGWRELRLRPLGESARAIPAGRPVAVPSRRSSPSPRRRQAPPGASSRYRLSDDVQASNGSNPLDLPYQFTKPFPSRDRTDPKRSNRELNMRYLLYKKVSNPKIRCGCCSRFALSLFSASADRGGPIPPCALVRRAGR